MKVGFLRLSRGSHVEMHCFINIQQKNYHWVLTVIVAMQIVLAFTYPIAVVRLGSMNRVEVEWVHDEYELLALEVVEFSRPRGSILDAAHSVVPLHNNSSAFRIHIT